MTRRFNVEVFQQLELLESEVAMHSAMAETQEHTLGYVAELELCDEEEPLDRLAKHSATVVAAMNAVNLLRFHNQPRRPGRRDWPARLTFWA